MNPREICERIVEQGGNCTGIFCVSNGCPFNNIICGTRANTLALARQWLEEHKEEPMDKAEAKQKLEELELWCLILASLDRERGNQVTDLLTDLVSEAKGVRP